MENKLPETLKKQISLIEGALYSDSDRRNPEYSKILKKTESREAVYDMLVRKSGNLDEISDEICEKCSNVMKNLTNDLMQCSDTISVSKKDVDWSLYKMAQKASDYYFEIGQMMNNYGLLDGINRLKEICEAYGEGTGRRLRSIPRGTVSSG